MHVDAEVRGIMTILKLEAAKVPQSQHTVEMEIKVKFGGSILFSITLHLQP